jgi:hypothetical protein
MTKRLWSLMGLCVFFASCASVDTPTITERSDSLSSTPEWTQMLRSNYEESGKRYFLGFVEINGNASKSAALNMADEKALSEPMRGLVDQFMDQNQIGENLRKNSSLGSRIISATRGYRPPMPSLQISKRYWEVVYSPHGTSLRAYALAEIPSADFEEAKSEFFSHLAGNSEMKHILSEVGKAQRKNILEDKTKAD